MTIWTDGKDRVVVGARGLSVHRGGGAELQLGLEQLGGKLAPKKGKTGFARLRPLAVGDGGKVAYTIDKDRNLVRTSLGKAGEGTRFPWLISTLAPADGDKVMATYVTGTKARAVTSVVIGTPPADPKGKWERSFEASRPAKVDWPAGLLWEKAPWSRKTRWATDPDLLYVDRNAHGYVVYDLASAVIGLLRPKDEDFACVLRLPKDKNTGVTATATAEGFLGAVNLANGAAALAHVSPDGKLLASASFTAKSLGPMTVIGDTALMLVDHAKFLCFALADLSLQGEVPLADDLPASQVLMRSAADGSKVLVSVDERIYEGTGSGASWSFAPVDLGDVPEASGEHEAEIPEAEIEEPDEPAGGAGAPGSDRQRYITQAPRLSLNPQQPNEAWKFPVSGAFEIVINAVSEGGKAEAGLFVEMSNEAIEKGLMEPVKATVTTLQGAEISGEFVAQGKKRVAKVDYLVPAGVEPIKDKKVKPKERFLDNPEDTFVTVRLEGKTAGPGSAMLYVRVGFEGSGTEGSLMRGRPVVLG